MAKISPWPEFRRKRFVRRGLRTGNSLTARRYLIIALLCEGLSPAEVSRRALCAESTVTSVRRRFEADGETGLLDHRSVNGELKADPAFALEVRRVLRRCPPDFGWDRPTWTRELLCLVLHERGFPKVSACTMGRVLASLGARRGPPKPFVRCPWPSRKRERRLGRLRALAKRSTRREPVFYEDEVDIHLNPKLGLDWMLPGQQRRVPTPGKNKKHYVAGALNALTKELVWAEGPSKSSALFCKLVWKLMSTCRTARRVHLILDNYIIHSSKKTQAFLKQFGARLVLHFLPPYCPDHNRIEREWQNLHANVTRNHKHPNMDALLCHVFAYLEARQSSRTTPSLRRALAYAA
jgi:transposase